MRATSSIDIELTEVQLNVGLSPDWRFFRWWIGTRRPSVNPENAEHWETRIPQTAKVSVLFIASTGGTQKSATPYVARMFVANQWPLKREVLNYICRAEAEMYERSRRFTTVARLCENCAKDQPIVCQLDHEHYSQRSSRAVISTPKLQICVVHQVRRWKCVWLVWGLFIVLRMLFSVGIATI